MANERPARVGSSKGMSALHCSIMAQKRENQDKSFLPRNNLGWCGGDMGMPTLQNIQYILKIKKNIFGGKISVYSVYKKTENLCPFFSWFYYSLLQNHTYSIKIITLR